ncbi:ATP-dependent helicase HrpB [Solimonas sp. K1W22B-7]|uniref:ATP-dependent helicase HrpB n=1 Tax=Solimonas sp. K1W22B-7 TaxID=2303331 RepID=UPI000E33122A|nr:ATP-dependent helicase HrpB [Solimonas sp. K1W22B-7]AXQ30843.1 ATP-dependent helicase HrpB [Solimonas sp. K1W22B-7]
MKLPLPDLPVREALPALRQALSGGGRAVLAAPPGSGKTTLIPLELLAEPWLKGLRIVMLEPRRVAARAAAARMAQLLGEPVGQTVGYQIRFERKVSAATRIEVVTEGLLARRLQADPELPGVGLLIFDEFHERSLDADLALALSLDVRANLNPELRLLVMSATLDTQRVARLLDDAPVVQSGGQLFPVDIRYLTQRADADHGEVVAQGVITALAETPGDVLAFLPGAREIRGAQRRLEARTQAAIYPLYGELSSAEQDAALQPDRDGRRKVILATNIAQTSLTVEGVTTVVDGGLVRVARFDLGAGANRLETQRVSRASADQRAGRAGRLGPGHCYRLWNRDQQAALAQHDTPEILAADLSRFALELAVWGASEPAQLGFLDPPGTVSWTYARELLRELGAVNAQGRITPHGRELARLPAAPRRAQMLLLAKARGLGALAAWTAAVLEERDGGASDLAATVQAYLQGRAADPNALRRVRDSARQMGRQVDATEQPVADDRDVARLVSWAYPERIARRRGSQRGVYLCEDGGEARIGEHDPLSASEWLAIAHWDPGPPRKIRLAAALREDELLRDQAARIVDVQDCRWDPQTDAVVSETQRRLGAIVLERRMLRGGAEEKIRTAMLAGIRALGLQALPWNEAARQWQARVLSLRQWRPEDSWPDVSDEGLLATLEDWLAPSLDGVTRRDHLARLDLMEILNASLDYATQQKLGRLAPTHMDVPTGSRVRLEYRPPEAPLLSVRLQEMFGCAQTPTVNDGRNRVVLELLSPGQRPVAITPDLAGFWAGSYSDVKKDMKGRYPRHPWPDNPLEAAPTRRAKPRGT